MKEYKVPMKERPVFPLLMSMAVPIVISMTINSLYNIIDSIWVTRLGTDALTAVSLAFPLQHAILSLGVGFGIGVNSVISMELGRGNRKKADSAASTGLLMVLFHCAFFLIGGLLFIKPFLKLFTDDPQILKWSCEYAYIVVCISAPQLLGMTLEKVLQSVGRMKITMLIMATGGIINIVLDPVLIFGLMGFPEMGVKGAAIATVFGQSVALVLYCVDIAFHDIGVKPHIKSIVKDSDLLKRLYGVGIPSSLMLAMPAVLTGVLNRILLKFGSIYIAVFGLYFKLQTFVNLPSSGFIQGMRPIIGYNYGAGEEKRVKDTIKYSLAVIFTVMTLGTLVSLLFPEYILKLFDANKELVTCSIPALRIIGSGFIISTVSIVTCGVFEALGKGKNSLLISSMRQLILIIPLSLIFSHFKGITGVWIAFPVSEFITLILSLKMLLSADLKDPNRNDPGEQEDIKNA